MYVLCVNLYKSIEIVNYTIGIIYVFYVKLGNFKVEYFISQFVFYCLFCDVYVPQYLVIRNNLSLQGLTRYPVLYELFPNLHFKIDEKVLELFYMSCCCELIQYQFGIICKNIFYTRSINELLSLQFSKSNNANLLLI